MLHQSKIRNKEQFIGSDTVAQGPLPGTLIKSWVRNIQYSQNVPGSRFSKGFRPGFLRMQKTVKLLELK